MCTIRTQKAGSGLDLTRRGLCTVHGAVQEKALPFTSQRPITPATRHLVTITEFANSDKLSYTVGVYMYSTVSSTLQQQQQQPYLSLIHRFADVKANYGTYVDTATLLLLLLLLLLATKRNCISFTMTVGLVRLRDMSFVDDKKLC
ncbi:hypothetical protein BP00DRAFT_413372 [Aspergillus indologenus CBS 114.80]|uniref:Uncharacterized protein n=1 Tax=Aspergillus indologenus CBS 114.80 TaxID=1450541 RepID=A0A2V5IIR5_9EURO|nr:hypothetical protein BP00DRAFT_413372 [Aspergillus indologenus CBS 114.80]